MSPNTPHGGFLWPHLVAYHEFKQRLGYVSFRNTVLARDMDEFTAYRYLGSIKELDERFVFEWIHMLSRRGPRTKNHMLSYAKGFFDYLVRQGLLADNPALRIPPIKFRPYKPHLYSLLEIHRLLQRAAQLKSPLGPTLSMLLLLLYACGLRIGEALRLHIQDVDFQHNTLSLWNTKFHKERLVPFSVAIAAKLKTYFASRQKAFPTSNPRAPFFCHTNGPLSYTYTLTLFHNLRRQAGLLTPGVCAPRLHDLRHTFAVHRLYKWYQEGHDILNKLPILSTYMGHVGVKETQVYLSVTQALLREGDKRFQKSFENLNRPIPQRLFKPL